MDAAPNGSPRTRSLAGRTVLVTGAGSGLGRAISLRLGRAGACVVVGDVRFPDAQDTAALVDATGGSASAVALDVTDPEQVRAELGRLSDRFGDRFDCLVNNAGIDHDAILLELTDEQWHHVVAVNQSGPLFTTRAFLQHVLAAGPRELPADIVNVISISAITVGTGAAAYNSSKAALAKLTEVMQREAHEYRWPARIHGIMPSAMNTPMMARWNLGDEVMMDPDTVASAVEFMITLPADTFVQNLTINSRREPSWPR